MIQLTTTLLFLAFAIISFCIIILITKKDEKLKEWKRLICLGLLVICSSSIINVISILLFGIVAIPFGI